MKKPLAEQLEEIDQKIVELTYDRVAVPCTPRMQPKWDELQAQIEELQKRRKQLMLLNEVGKETKFTLD